MATPRRILFASLLKPLGDPRMYEKMAGSLAATGRYDVHVVGHPQEALALREHITLHPLPAFKRLSLGRWKARWQLWATLRRVKPDITVVNTHEYLIVISLHRIFFGGCFLYDVQENYRLNLWTQSIYKSVIKYPIGLLIRWKECLTRPAVGHYLLAEESYAHELRFTRGKFTLLENKALAPRPNLGPPPTWPGTGDLRLLYSGTIAEVYGIFEAIDWAERLHEIYPLTQLRIVGYCAKSETLERLKARIADLDFIQLEGGDYFVPHERIEGAASEVHFGLLPYPENPSTWRCRPTKLFEYATWKLPMLCVANPLWTEKIEAWGAGLAVDFQAPPTPEILYRMGLLRPYPNGAPSEASWASEGEKLVALFDGIS